MKAKTFALEKIFGSRTRVKVISLFTAGISRPYYVREISRAVGERLNAVRRELEILQKIGMLKSYTDKRRKYFVANQDFILFNELTSIMKKTGPTIEDGLFKNIGRLGTIHYACVSGFFTGAENSPTDLLIIGEVNEDKLKVFAEGIERQVNHEISYTPITENEYRYRRNFNDLFLRQIFSAPHKAIVNNLPSSLQPDAPLRKRNAAVVQN